MTENGKPAEGGKPAEHGFEFDGEFFRIAISDGGKDLMLIDRFYPGDPTDVFQAVELGVEESEIRVSPFMLALVATSIRAKHPEWSVERITNRVQNIGSFSREVIWFTPDEEDVPVPPAVGSEAETPEEPTPSPSPPDASSSSPTPKDTLNSETLYGVPA